MKNYFSENLRSLSKLYTQKDIAQKTNASQASITNYINGQNEPSLSFIMALKKSFDINIEDFLLKPIDFAMVESFTQSRFNRFSGNYIFYYYDTSAYKGSANIYIKNALNYGVISITTSQVKGESLKTFAQFLLSRKEAEQLLADLNNKSDKEIAKYYGLLPNWYEGTTTPKSSHIFLSLKNHTKSDETFMILNNPPSNKKYIGGMSTINSISHGREHMPCIQYGIMSRYSLNITDGQLYNLLALNTPEVNIDLDIEQLIELFKTLYLNSSDTTLALNDYQKKRILEESVKNTLEDLLETNVFKFAKVSDMEDDRYYRIIKEEMFNE